MRQYARQCPSGGTETWEPTGRTAGPTEAAHGGGKQKSGKATAAATCAGTAGSAGSSSLSAARGFFLEGDEELLELEEEDDEEEEEDSDDELESDEDSVSSRFRSLEPRCRPAAARRPLLHSPLAGEAHAGASDGAAALLEAAAFECADWPRCRAI